MPRDKRTSVVSVNVTAERNDSATTPSVQAEHSATESFVEFNATHQAMIDSALDSAIPPVTPTVIVEVTYAATATPEIVALRKSIADMRTVAESTPHQFVKDAIVEAIAKSAAQLEALESEAVALAAYDADVATAVASVEAWKNDPTLRQTLLDSMLRAIEAKYMHTSTPASEIPQVQAESAPPAIGTARRVSDRAAAINAAVVGNDALRNRAIDTYTTFRKSADDSDCKVHHDSGTRYPTVVCFARDGAGVANYADCEALTAAIRHYLREDLQVGNPESGNRTADAIWIGRQRIHAPGGTKEKDWFGAHFKSGASVGLYPDGRFRIAAPGTPGVRFIASDAAAYEAFTGKGSSGAPASVPTAPQSAPQAPTHTPRVPTPPTVQADSTTGRITRTAFCQHCASRNPIGIAACINAKCGKSDWLAAE
jgi:hypothetical protein